MLGIGRKAFATLTLLVGCCGTTSFFVIFVGGMGCIGAYRVGPVCIVYATSNTLSAGTELTPTAASPVLSTAAGPSFPVTVFIPSVTTVLNAPVIPERVKRFE
jgi:hypothetical protein